MADNGRLYDPHGGVQPEQQGAGNSTIDHIQAQINAVTTKMQQNIQGASERGQRLDHLQNQSSNLQENASHFNRRANKLRKDMWWKDMKMRICIIVGIIILLVVIIVPAAVVKSH